VLFTGAAGVHDASARSIAENAANGIMISSSSAAVPLKRVTSRFAFALGFATALLRAAIFELASFIPRLIPKRLARPFLRDASTAPLRPVVWHG
jgi:hypothetical protein